MLAGAQNCPTACGDKLSVHMGIAGEPPQATSRQASGSMAPILAVILADILIEGFRLALSSYIGMLQ